MSYRVKNFFNNSNERHNYYVDLYVILSQKFPLKPVRMEIDFSVFSHWLTNSNNSSCMKVSV